MNYSNYSYYLPPSVTAGLFNAEDGSKLGFITCKYMDKGWLKASTFKRLTDGYGPAESKSSEIQIKKAIYNKVSIFLNRPVEGFRITGNTFNIYKYNTGKYNNGDGDVIISDPRGFKIGITLQNFVKIIANADISKGLLIGKYSYAWSTDNSHNMILLKDGTPEFEAAVKCKNEFDDSKKLRKMTTIKKNELVIGDAYSAAENQNALSGDWVYAGIHDTYSGECHFNAFDTGKYDIDSARQNNRRGKFITSVGNMIFFPAEFQKDKPWISRSNITEMFKGKAQRPRSFTFFDSPPEGVPATIDSINAAISSNPAFQRIDFTRFKDENAWEPLDFSFFKYMSNGFPSAQAPCCFSQFPFSQYYYACITLKSANCQSYKAEDDGYWIRISRSFNNDKWYVKRFDGNYTRFISYGTYSNTYDEMYNRIKPIAPKMYFENGNPVPQYISVLFIPKRIRTAY